MSDVKILMYTPTSIARRSNPFLGPCWTRKQIIRERHFETVEPLYLTSASMPEDHETAYQYALAKKMDWVLQIEDDVLPPLDVIDRFLEYPQHSVMCGRLRMRFDPRIWTPYRCTGWDFKLQGFAKSRQLMPGELTRRTLRVEGIGQPIMYKPQALAKARIHFRGPNSQWDHMFSRDLYLANVPVICVTAVKSKHYDIEKRRVLS